MTEFLISSVRLCVRYKAVFASIMGFNCVSRKFKGYFKNFKKFQGTSKVFMEVSRVSQCLKEVSRKFQGCFLEN